MKKESKKSATGSTACGNVVYCGPTIKGVCKQYTVYAGALPVALKEYVDARPEAKALLVGVERYPEVRKNLNKQGSAEAILYQKLLSE